jgi:hypothetical protein
MIRFGSIPGFTRALAVLALLTALTAAGSRRAEAQYAIDWWTIDGGGALSVGGDFRLSGTVGQFDSGQFSGGGFAVGGGYRRSGTATVDVGEGPGPATEEPRIFALRQGYPNPLRDRTLVAFDLPRPAHVLLRVFDAGGRLTRTLANGALPAGRHQSVWDGANDRGSTVPAGMYFIRLDSEVGRATRKIVVMR